MNNYAEVIGCPKSGEAAAHASWIAENRKGFKLKASPRERSCGKHTKLSRALKYQGGAIRSGTEQARLGFGEMAPHVSYRLSRQGIFAAPVESR